MPYIRVTRDNRCPICDHPDWCMVSTDGEMAICPRVVDGSSKYIDGAGYLHRLKRNGSPRKPYRHPTLRIRRKSLVDAPDIALNCALILGPEGRQRLADDLGVTAQSLMLLLVGWHERLNAHTFPMCDGKGVVIGIRTRFADGSKRAIPGSRAGLFIPTEVGGGTIYICEGPTDTAAMLSLGLTAIGRPSCMGSHKQVKEFLADKYKRDVVIIHDNDGPGREGAVRLRDAIGVGRLTAPPTCVKDVRQRAAKLIREAEEVEDTLP